jgi:hypothetical protein
MDATASFQENPLQHLRPNTAILDELLRRAHFRSDVYFRNKLCNSWSFEPTGTGRVSFHIVWKDSC